MRKAFAWLLALTTATALTLTTATPAHAAEEDCPEIQNVGYVCLWKWINFEGGRWQAKLETIADLPANGSRPAGCWNLADSTFGSPHLGAPVNNESASLVIEPDSYPFTVQFYDWVNCNTSQSSFLWTRSAHNTYTAIAHLGGPMTPFPGYHKITSIRVF